MPPSPAMRISPGREVKAENHKRGHSLESGILFREKDDDLALFNEVKNKERENFLLQSNDDLDDIISTKLRHFSDYKLGISTRGRGESSDLLNAEGDKNDYDWLITPPDTPLFRSLDDEAPTVSLAPRGRPRSQPITISRSSTMEKSYRSSRGSSSPQRLSPSPKSGNSILQSRGRPFSATHSSPPPTLRHISPSRRLSPPPSKPTPPPRSGTPIPRRMSTGSAGATAPSRVRGASPIKTSRGNSASPKIRAWQSNIPGFSSEAPPNLRTSLTDRPASYVRGSSPASRNGSRTERQSMSPTASRSVRSSHSHDRDQFSSYSKGSVVSFGDDDVDSLQSHPRSVGTPPNNRAVGFSKKPTKTLSSSAPNRSFDVAPRQMDKKSPQNMFRPLLSSVPSSTFYSGKVSVHHRTLTSRNSSITTSSNASSDQGTSGALDTEESERNQEDLTGDFVKGQYPTVYDEVFAMDQTDALNETVDNRIIEESPGCMDGEDNDPSVVISQLGVCKSSGQLDTTTAMSSGEVVLDKKYDCSHADGTPDLEVCSACGRTFHSVELVREGNLWFCMECKGMEVNSTTIASVETVMEDSDNVGDFVHIQGCGLSQVTCAGETGKDPLGTTVNEGQHSYSEANKDLALSLAENRELELSTQEIVQSVDGDTDNQQSQQSGDTSEGMGISLLLESSSSKKGRFVQSRSFTASSISYNDFSYMRDNVNSMRSSIGHSTASVSSSVDLGSSTQRIHRQSSGRKYEIENYRNETPTKHKRSISSLSGASGHVSQVPSIAPSCLGDSFEVISSGKDKKISAAIHTDPLEQSLTSECTEAESTCSDIAELASHWMNVHSGDTPIVSILPSEETSSHVSENLLKESDNAINEETSAALLQPSTQGEVAVESLCADRVDVVEVSQPSSLDNVSEIEIENDDIVSVDSKSDADSSNLETCRNELLDPSGSETYHEFTTTAVVESDISVPVIHEESTVVLEDPGGTKPRSLTLEEATDAILFCSSVVHNLAYEAANIAINKEKSSLRPTVTTFVGKSNPTRRDMRSTTLGKRSSKSQKNRQKKLETNAVPPLVVNETDEKPTPRIVKSPSKADDSMHPPKLESKCNCTIM